MASQQPVVALAERFEEALTLAARLHATQRRKGTGIPYIAHLLGVAGLVLDYGGTEDEAIAALLHDAVEDQGGTRTAEEIRNRFGDDVTVTVLGCSDSVETPKRPWRERKESYIAHVAGSSPSVLLVSAADKLHNARAILSDYRVLGDALWERFKGGKDGTLWYYRSLVDAFRQSGINPMLIDELDRVITELEALAADRSDDVRPVE